ncbi:MAG: DivIVA domain-containing protein [Oscillospiraceae bacterium]|jgi:cell division initiation protein
MLTPQDVQEKRFSKALFNGYDMGEVDDFLDPLTEDYAALYKENALLKSKMKVLVEKIEEYRATEESMKKALRSARSMAAEIVEDAKKQSAAIEGSPDIEAIRRQADAEEARLKEAKRQTAVFIAEIKRFLKAEAELISSLRSVDTEPAPYRVPQNAETDSFERPAGPKAEPEPGDPVDITVRDIEDSLSKIVSDDTPDELEPVEPEDNDVPINDLIADIRRETEEMERQAEARLAGSERKARRIDPDLEETRPRFDFTNLQFGKDYDIKR